MADYSVESVKKTEACYECGEQATVVLVADYAERDTGYLEEVPLCEDCTEKRGV